MLQQGQVIGDGKKYPLLARYDAECKHAGQDKLYFVEFIGSLSFLDNLSSGSPGNHLLGTGYTEPEDVYVTSDGSTAYITERSGDLVQVNLSNPNRDRDQAKVIASGLTAPQQIVVDEAGGFAYTVEFANPGRLLRIDLNTGNLTVVSGNLQNAIGLLMTPDFKAAYITEQLDNNTGKLVRIDLSNSNSTVLVTSTTAPFFLIWEIPSRNAHASLVHPGVSSFG